MRRLADTSAEFRERYRWRAGVEATMSRFKHQMGMRRLRVRGMKQVSYTSPRHYLSSGGLGTLKAIQIGLLKSLLAAASCSEKRSALNVLALLSLAFLPPRQLLTRSPKHLR